MKLTVSNFNKKYNKIKTKFKVSSLCSPSSFLYVTVKGNKDRMVVIKIQIK